MSSKNSRKRRDFADRTPPEGRSLTSPIWDVQWNNNEIRRVEAKRINGVNYNESRWYIFRRIDGGVPEGTKEPPMSAYANRLPAKGQFLWDRTVLLSVVIGKDRDTEKAFVVLGPLRSVVGQNPIEPKWTKSDLDAIYTTITGGGTLSLIFSGSGYYERIKWCLVNHIMSAKDIQNSPELKEVVDYNESSGPGRWLQWVALSFQNAQVGGIVESVSNEYQTLLNDNIGIVQPDGKIVYNKLIKVDNFDPNVNVPSPFDFDSIPSWLKVIGFVVAGSYAYSVIKKD